MYHLLISLSLIMGTYNESTDMEQIMQSVLDKLTVEQQINQASDEKDPIKIFSKGLVPETINVSQFGRRIEVLENNEGLGDANNVLYVKDLDLCEDKASLTIYHDGARYKMRMKLVEGEWVVRKFVMRKKKGYLFEYKI